MISVIITSYNEAEHLAATIANVRANTSDCEIVLVDDGSDDGSCKPGLADVLVRHETRIGIAASRNDGVAAAHGGILCFLDAHQTVSEGCINQLAKLALESNSITYPCVRGPVDRRWTGHGCRFLQKYDKKIGLFGAAWKVSQPVNKVSRCATMIVPGYVFTREIYQKVRWIDGLRGWGCSEPAITVKAFFQDIDILHLCGPLSRHVFRGRMPYSAPWKEIARNHAIVARVCFSDETWKEYWEPNVFRRQHFPLEEFYEGPIYEQHLEFQKVKVRPDEEYWRGLLQQERVA